jgi:hypothetical protein
MYNMVRHIVSPHSLHSNCLQLSECLTRLGRENQMAEIAFDEDVSTWLIL